MTDAGNPPDREPSGGVGHLDLPRALVITVAFLIGVSLLLTWSTAQERKATAPSGATTTTAAAGSTT